MTALPLTRLYWRAALHIGAALIAFVSLAVIGLALVASSELENYTATRHSGLGRQAAEVLAQAGRPGLIAWLGEQAQIPPDVTVYVLDSQAQDILGRPLPPLYAGFIRRSVVQPGNTDQSNYQPVRLAPQLLGPNGDRYAFLVLPNKIGILGSPATRLALLATALLVMATVAWLIARSFARPIGELQRTVRELASGQIAARVPDAIVARRDELGALAQDFNAMADRNAALLEQRGRLLGELSHELRSPLARLRATLALAAQRPDHDGTDRARMEQEIARMDGLIGDMLRYSRLEAAPLPVRRLVRIDTLLEQLMADCAVEAQSLGCPVHAQIEPNLRTVGDPDSLRSAFENVLRNALKFSRRGEKVELRARAVGDCLEVQIQDRGPGVPSESLDKIFEPFYRVATPGNVSATGTGLGLAIARRVVEAHGGSIAAAPRDGGGLVVLQTLPLASVS